MAGFATRPRVAGHTGRSARTNHKLTFTVDHSMGAGQCSEQLAGLEALLIVSVLRTLSPSGSN